ncbi:G-type lectin S-receptor-like serine/threonine-protein kinase At2g19130 [Triticum urartu]|nr:G-type lectin S-receptor-like serine/threonine-protein kinase At2g19130 [Triticum urartu]
MSVPRPIDQPTHRPHLNSSRLAMPLPVLLALLCALHAPASSASTATYSLSPGQSLAGDDKLVSSGGKFALGFIQIPGSDSNPSGSGGNSTQLGIWFSLNRVPKLTLVWVANRGGSPVAGAASPELTISGDGNLVIVDRGKVAWSTRADVTANNNNNNRTVLLLLDTGNLVLRSASNASDVMWQSFDHPTDTLLPGATIGLDKVTGRSRRLVSRKNRIDQAPGAYSMELGRSGVVQMLWDASVPYWSSGEWNGDYFSSVPEMTARHLIGSTFVNDDREVSFAYHLLDETITMYSFLDVSGQRKMLVWQDATRDWVTVYVHPTTQCEVHAVCGPFTACDDSAPAPCSCMKGFSVGSPEDWDLDDRSTSGCRRNTQLNCASISNGTMVGMADMFYAMPAVRLPYNPHSAAGYVASAAECEQVCLSNCSCTAYSFGSGGCSMWHGGLLNVKQRQIDGASSSGDGEILHIRLAAKEFRTRKNNSVVIILVAIGAGLNALVILVLVVVLRRTRRNKRYSETLDKIHGGSGLVSFRYSDLRRATRDFSEKIGAGGFGSVFKGSLNDSTTIAVKRLYGCYQQEKQFRAEVSSIGILHHTNLVKMVGFCCEGDKKLLVYEHMPNSSLDAHLFRSSAKALNWRTRYQIALGVARGLAYLHESCLDYIIHCDIKPQNILLDALFVPKIADFGMAKLLTRDFSRVMTTTRGTIGYLAPEWISGVAITPKVDVYGYGMVLLEIISGRMNANEECGSSGDGIVYFPIQMARKLLEGNVMSFVDDRLNGDVIVDEVERACKVACWCIQDREFERPTMGKVVQILEGLVEVDTPPMPKLLEAIAGRSHSACT